MGGGRGQQALPAVYWGVSILVRDRCRPLGLSGVAALAGGLRLSALRACRRLAPVMRATSAACGARTAVTAGTLFDRRRTPLTVWFTACWMFAVQVAHSVFASVRQ
jgi:hypothetical protein